MIALLVRWSVANRFLVLLATLFVTAWGVWAVQNTPVDTPQGSQITLGTVARLKVCDGPWMLKSENARPFGWVYIHLSGGITAPLLSLFLISPAYHLLQKLSHQTQPAHESHPPSTPTDTPPQ
ncbi:MULTISPECIES: hypothetical protein [unclassified Pseudomonas]|uniref:hypothetical protein n=1 Tax=unclassified Pseudomonas TaxID=196821 RepID=UPI001F5A9B1E|nr:MULTISPECIES: hypothetical protein [unclassified Pseudomonas]